MTETLRDLLELAKQRQQKSSGRALADLTKDRRDKIDRTQINQLLAGTYKHSVQPSTVRAIAFLAEVDEERAFRAAGVPVPGPPLADELPPESDYLEPYQRLAVINVIRAFARGNKAVASHAADEHGDEPQLSLVARDTGRKPGAQALGDEQDEAAEVSQDENPDDFHPA